MSYLENALLKAPKKTSNKYIKYSVWENNLCQPVMDKENNLKTDWCLGKVSAIKGIRATIGILGLLIVFIWPGKNEETGR